MKRTPINPWDWSLQYGFNQAEVIEGSNRMLVCSGQTSLDGEGKVQCPDDMGGQIAAALSNLEEVLAGAGMGLSDLVRLTIYTTDVDALLENWEVFAARMAGAGVAPPQTLIGVARLAFPELMVEIEATAAD